MADPVPVKIIQIAPVVENSETGSEDRGTWQILPNAEATVYGLGDDGQLYIWAVVKSTRVEHTDPDPDADGPHEAPGGYYYEKEYGWRAA